MPLSDIQAYEAYWSNHHEIADLPISGNQYTIYIDKTLALQPAQEIWVVYDKVNAFRDDDPYLCKGTVLELYPPDSEENNPSRGILFQMTEIGRERNILSIFPETAYTEELSHHLRHEYDACGHFGNILELYIYDGDNYSLEADYYGHYTAIFLQKTGEKMYIWKTKIGYGMLKHYYGKYLAPEWLLQIIADPGADSYIRVYDQTQKKN